MSKAGGGGEVDGRGRVGRVNAASAKSLAAIQRDVFRALERGRPGDPRASRHVQGQGSLGPAARLRIYSDQYPLRLHDALYQDHPHLIQLLGERRFHRMVKAYGQAVGSRHYSLGAFGGGLARWLARRPAGFTRPDLADLARFEWALTQSFIAPDPGPLVTVEALAALGPERFPAASVRLTPSVRLVPLRHDVVSVVEALDAEKPAPRPKEARSIRLVWRQGMEVFHLPVKPREARALGLIEQGAALAEVCGAFGDGPTSAQAAFSALSLWAREELLCDLRVPK